MNECQIGLHDCQPLERCDNTIGSYHCSRIYGCGTGYTLNLENGLCEDDDECALGTHNCLQLGSNFECKNTLGSYRCMPVRARRPSYSEYQTPSTTTTTTTITTTTTPKPFIPPSTQQTVQSVPIYRHPYSAFQTPPPYHPTKFTYLTTGYTNATTPPTRPSIYFKPPPNTPDILPYFPKPSARPPPIRVYPNTPVRQYPIITGQLKKCLPGYTMNSKGECDGKILSKLHLIFLEYFCHIPSTH